MQLLRFGNVYQFSKGSCIVDSQVCQHLTVDDNAGFRKAADEAAVAHALSAGCCVDTGDPQFTEFAFLGAAVAASVKQSFHYAFISFFEQTAAGTAVALAIF